MICPKCDKPNLVPTGTVVKEDEKREYYECNRCGYIFIVRKKNQSYSEPENEVL